MRYYVGIDWADQEHAVWVAEEAGKKVTTLTVKHTAAGLSDFGRWLLRVPGPGDRALGRDRAARGPAGGLPPGSWGGGVPD